MSSGYAAYPNSDKAHYRIGQKVEKKRWWRRSTGWFGEALFLLLSVGLLGFGWTARESFLATMNAQLDSQVTPSTTQLPMTEPIAGLPVKANNIVTMQPVIADWAKAHPDQKWSIVAKSIDGPVFEASYKPDLNSPMADLYKLFLMQPLFESVPLAKQWQTTLSVDKSKRAVARCVDLVLRLSDDACATAIGNYLNWDKATQTLKDAGYKRTDLASQGQPVSTANDIAAYIQSLYGGMFDTKTRKAVLTPLQKREAKQGIIEGCPGCTYIGMAGQNGGIVADAEIVQYSRGTYVLVVLSDGGNYEQLAKLAGKVQQRIVDETR